MSYFLQLFSLRKLAGRKNWVPKWYQRAPLQEQFPRGWLAPLTGRTEDLDSARSKKLLQPKSNFNVIINFFVCLETQGRLYLVCRQLVGLLHVSRTALCYTVSCFALMHHVTFRVVMFRYATAVYVS